ncbi:MAG TPA: hypothetical protein VM054_11380 [bacterium]|nr:hypothetical protein [bacterium]
MKTVILMLVLPLVALAGLDAVFLVGDFYQYWSEVVEYVRDDPRFEVVYFYNIMDFTPPLEFMRNFDALFIGGTYTEEPDEFGDNLADYVDGGGCVVCISEMLFYDPGGWGIGGRWLDDEYAPYGPIPGEFYVYDYQDLNILEPEHPIFEGVSHLSDVYYHILLELRPGAHEIADFPLYPGIAVNAGNTVVGLDYTSNNPQGWTGDGFLIMANAACYLAAHSDVKETSWGVIKAAFD